MNDIALVYSMYAYFLFFFEKEPRSVTRLKYSGAISTLTQLLTPWFSRFSCLSLLSSWDYRCTPPYLANFCIFSRERVSPCCPGLSRSLDHMIHPLQPPSHAGVSQHAWPKFFNIDIKRCLSPFSYLFIYSFIFYYILGFGYM